MFIVVGFQWVFLTYIMVPMRGCMQKHGQTDMEKEWDVMGLWTIQNSRFGLSSKCTFSLWFVLMSIFTLLNLLDNMTNALITANLFNEVLQLL